LDQDVLGGFSVWSVWMFPFGQFASIYYTYLITKKWFTIQTAQFSALAIACLTYPILYSQLARPYCAVVVVSVDWLLLSKLLFDVKIAKDDACICDPFSTLHVHALFSVYVRDHCPEQADLFI